MLILTLKTQTQNNFPYLNQIIYWKYYHFSLQRIVWAFYYLKDNKFKYQMLGDKIKC